MKRDGLVDGLAESDYHSGPELSVSGAKVLRKSPALYQWQKDHPQHKDVFDFGSVVHGLILGTGWPVEVIDADDWRGKAAREAKDAARAEGKVPLLRDDYARAEAIRAAVLAHPLAGPILTSPEGRAEQSLFWTDERTGVRCRARADWLHPIALADVKSAADASPDGFAKAAANFGYDMQAFAYSEGYQVVTGEAVPFLFIAVEKEPPHLVAVYDLDGAALERGARLWREALDSFAACSAADHWPGYGSDITTLSLPRWAA